MLAFQGMTNHLLSRSRHVHQVNAAFRRGPIAAILGPRQVGKTTLARIVAKGSAHEYFDLEDPLSAARLREPMQTLSALRGLVVIDEVQRQPKLFEVLRVLVDRPGNRARFLILGSASPQLVKGVSESLAGRVSFIDLPGFNLEEVGIGKQAQLWLRGGFPRSFLARSNEQSFAWREDFIRTLLERDVPQLGITVPSETLSRYWSMIAHYHGQTVNHAELARALGSSEPTAKRYLDLLTGLFMVRQLQPWFENVGKRLVKSPKVYVRDSGLLHAIFGLPTKRDLEGHPKLGASWEGFAMEQIIQQAKGYEPYFWATHSGAELDLLLVRGQKRVGVEFKYADAPKLTNSMKIAMEDLRLKQLFVVYPGEPRFALQPKIECIGLNQIQELDI